MRMYCVPSLPSSVAHAARAHVVGHARARGFAEEDHRQAAAGGDPLHVADLAAVGGGRRRAHHGEVVGDHGALAAVDLAEARDLAVGRRSCRDPRAHAEVPNRPDSMKRAGIEQLLDALARIEHAGGLAAGELLGSAHGERPGLAGPSNVLGAHAATTPSCASASMRASSMPSTSRSTARESWPMSRPAWRTPPGVSDRRGHDARHGDACRDAGRAPR